MAKLPSLVSKLPNDLKQFLERVREALTTGGLDRLVSARDLIDSGIAKDANLTPGAAGEVYAIPPAPINVTASGALANIMVEWGRPVYAGHSHAEIWAAEVDDLSQAVQVGMAPGAIFVHNIGGAATRWYWIRFVNLNGVVGAYNATGGTRGDTGQDPGYLLDLLTGEITEGQLYQSLSERINLIDADETVPGSVTQRVFAEAVIRANALATEAATREAAITQEANIRQSADASLAEQITTLSAGVAGNTAAIQTEAATRASAVSAEAQSRETLASQLRGDYIGNDLNALTGGLLYTERLVRSTQTENLARSISTLAVGTAQGLDAYQTWYFDTPGSLEGWVGTGVVVTQDYGYLAQTSVTGANYASRYIERTGLSFSGGKYNTVRVRVKRISGSGWDWRLTFQANGSWQTGVTAAAQTIAIGEFATVEFDLSAVASWMGGTITGLRIYAAPTTSDRWNFDYIAAGRVGPGASTASLMEEASVRAAADGTLQAQYTVKIDNAGYVSGFGLASSAPVDAAPFSEFIVKADRFAIGSPVGEIIPFVVNTTTQTVNGVTVPAGVYMDAAFIKDGTITKAKIGNAVIDDAKIIDLSADKVSFGEMSGDRISVGSLSANRIRTGTLSATAKIYAGLNNEITIDGAGSITADGSATKTVMSAGNVTTFLKVGGQEYPYQSLTHVEVGVCQNNTQVTIPGYFRQQPKVLVSPAELGVFKKEYYAQSQTLVCTPGAVTETVAGSYVWRFTPRATLSLLGTEQGTAINSYSGVLSSDSYTSTTRTTPGNTKTITAGVQFLSVRGTGTSGSYYNRRVVWRIEYSQDGVNWTPGGSRTIAIGDNTTQYVNDSATQSLPSAGIWHWRVVATASDTGTTFSTGAVQYETATVYKSVSGGGTVTSPYPCSLSQQTWAVNLEAYTPPTGWSIDSVTYNFTGSASANYAYSSSTGGNGYVDFTMNGVRQTIYLNNSTRSGSLTRNETRSNYITSNSVYIRLNCGSPTNYLSSITGSLSVSAQINIKRPITNSTTPANNFNLISSLLVLDNAVVLAEGTLNWMAVGA